MFRRLFVSLFALLVGLALPASVIAQEYLFRVDRESVDVFWNADGSESIEYTFAFTNQPGAHPIDFVDVGMPNSSFDISTATADVNGSRVQVSQSDYQGTGSGFSVVMGPSTIQPGNSGSVHVLVGRVTGVLRPDDNDSNYASAVFAPAYFGSKYVSGSTDMTVAFHLPPGVKPEEPKYHMAQNWPGSPEPQAGIDSQGRITYTWSTPNASAAAQYAFGASFPKSYVPADTIVTTPPINFGPILLWIAANMGTLFCFGVFAFMFIGLPILGVIQGQRRKLQYLSPTIAIAGHGIKRGLTAVEAAILLEEPLDKVLTMTLFGTIKKSAATVVSRDPLNIKVTDPLPAGLQSYETDFLKAFQLPDSPARQKALQAMMIALVKSVGEKMRGFSRKETQDYYKNIMEQAWTQVESAQTPDVKGQKIDDNLEWTMLDRNYDDRSRRAFSGPIYVPMWWGRFDPTYQPMSTASTSGAPLATGSRGGGSSALPGANLAASVVGGVQTFSTKAIGNLNAFTQGVTNVTNPPPPPSTSSYRGGGGGGGGCACACACAGCACACAGGGR